MSEWQAITAKIKRDDALRELDAAGCEAIIDALALVMYADDEASFLELSELELLLHALPWALSAPGEVERYTEQAVRRAQSLRSASARHAQVSDIAARLPSPHARKQTLMMAAAMAQANFHTSVAERALLMALADAFVLPRPIASAHTIEGRSVQAAGPGGAGRSRGMTSHPSCTAASAARWAVTGTGRASAFQAVSASAEVNAGRARWPSGATSVTEAMSLTASTGMPEDSSISHRHDQKPTVR